jgi:hypothetical protein
MPTQRVPERHPTSASVLPGRHREAAPAAPDAGAGHAHGTISRCLTAQALAGLLQLLQELDKRRASTSADSFGHPEARVSHPQPNERETTLARPPQQTP